MAFRHEKHHKAKKIHDESAKHSESANKAKKHSAAGGEVGNKNVFREAEEGAHGEHHIAGGTNSKLGRKRGGKVHGHHGQHKAHGGQVGADKHPFSSAHEHSKFEE